MRAFIGFAALAACAPYGDPTLFADAELQNDISAICAADAADPTAFTVISRDRATTYSGFAVAGANSSSAASTGATFGGTAVGTGVATVVTSGGGGGAAGGSVTLDNNETVSCDVFRQREAERRAQQN